jgi:hypothetical protein
VRSRSLWWCAAMIATSAETGFARGAPHGIPLLRRTDAEIPGRHVLEHGPSLKRLTHARTRNNSVAGNIFSSIPNLSGSAIVFFVPEI